MSCYSWAASQIYSEFLHLESSNDWGHQKYRCDQMLDKTEEFNKNCSTMVPQKLVFEGLFILFSCALLSSECFHYQLTCERDFQSWLADPIYTSLSSDIQTLEWTMPDPYQSPSNKVIFCTFGLPEAKSAGSSA